MTGAAMPSCTPPSSSAAVCQLDEAETFLGIEPRDGRGSRRTTDRLNTARCRDGGLGARLCCRKGGGEKSSSAAAWLSSVGLLNALCRQAQASHEKDGR